jgi:hypothetical protein
MEKRQRGEIEWRDIRRDRRLNIQRKERRREKREGRTRGEVYFPPHFGL